MKNMILLKDNIVDKKLKIRRDTLIQTVIKILIRYHWRKHHYKYQIKTLRSSIEGKQNRIE